MTGAGHMEPMLPDIGVAMSDTIVDLVAQAQALSGSLHPILRSTVGDLVRSMNCYYSNLIEGHHTQLIDIERALNNDYSAAPEKRDLQLEARAHIEVQRLIDHGPMPYPAYSAEGICWIHKAFCERLPASLLEVPLPGGEAMMTMATGALRQAHVMVGRHEAPEPESLPELLSRFTEAYTSPMLGRLETIASVAAGHHRLAWIHPFPDGNGRVARLVSHARLGEIGVGSELWSVSRGLARNVERYKALLQAADEPRRGALDGRGNLTAAGLAAFSQFFLETCLDQVVFMRALLAPAELMRRVEIWIDEEIAARRLPKGSWRLLRETILVGEFPRSAAEELTGYQERQARTVISSLTARGLLVSDTPKGPVRLGIPAEVTERWFPGLYQPETPAPPRQAVARKDHEDDSLEF